ncbi:MAG: sulfite exporter TauE/SafE family protein [Thermoguttaceae bacterium]
MDLVLVIFLIVSSFVAALISGYVGFGGAILLLPIITMSVGTEFAIPILTIAQLFGNVSRMAFGWNEIKWKSVGIFCATALPLASLGAFGFSVLPKNMVSYCVGMFMIIVGLFPFFGRCNLRNSKLTLIVGGSVTGGISGLCGTGGPIGAAVFSTLGFSPLAYIASEAATATAMHLFKMVIYGSFVSMAPESLIIGVGMGGAMVAGSYISNRLIKEINKKLFQKQVAVLLATVGVYMVIVNM